MTAETKGIPITGVFSKFYDSYNKWFGFGEAFRGQIVDEAALKPGQHVLDCGCGTGTLAVVAKRQVGAEGSVRGIDLSRDQLEKARGKAKREGFDIEFLEGSVDELPFPDKTFDAIFSTLMIHHLPREVKIGAFREMRRVLKPGGSVVIADFGPAASWWGWILFAPIALSMLIMAPPRDNLLNRLPGMMSEAGLKVIARKIVKQCVHLIKAE